MSRLSWGKNDVSSLHFFRSFYLKIKTIKKKKKKIGREE